MNKRQYKSILWTLTIIFSFLLLIILTYKYCRNYLEYDYRAQQMEAEKLLREIYVKQVDYKNINQHFASSFEELNCLPSNYFYGITFNNIYIEGDVGHGATRRLPNRYKTYFNSNGWNAFAVANQDADSHLDIWTINERGILIHLEDDAEQVIHFIPE